MALPCSRARKPIQVRDEFSTLRFTGPPVAGTAGATSQDTQLSRSYGPLVSRSAPPAGADCQATAVSVHLLVVP